MKSSQDKNPKSDKQPTKSKVKEMPQGQTEMAPQPKKYEISVENAQVLAEAIAEFTGKHAQQHIFGILNNSLKPV